MTYPTPPQAVTMMGFSDEWAVVALRKCNMDADRAVDFILENITEMDQVTVEPIR